MFCVQLSLALHINIQLLWNVVLLDVQYSWLPTMSDAVDALSPMT